MSRPQYLESEGFELAGQQPTSIYELTTTLLGVLRRRWLIILFVCTTSIVLAVTYVAVMPPQFTAVATMLIETGKVKPVDKSVYVETPVDTANIESQIQVLRSDSLALSVVKKLHLEAISVEESLPPAFSFRLNQLRGLFHRTEQVSEADAVRGVSRIH